MVAATRHECREPIAGVSEYCLACSEGPPMHNSDYLREQAEQYRQLAAAAVKEAEKKELLELADACEEVANKIDDLRASG